jgi:hypothetical protein
MNKAKIFTLYGVTYEITYSENDLSSSYYVFYGVKGTRNGEAIELKYLRVPIINSIIEVSRIDN